jgi:transposase-like protein
MCLWRAVDYEGEVLDMLVQRQRDTRAALRLIRKLPKKPGLRRNYRSPAGYAPTRRHSRIDC